MAIIIPATMAHQPSRPDFTRSDFFSGDETISATRWLHHFHRKLSVRKFMPREYLDYLDPLLNDDAAD